MRPPRPPQPKRTVLRRYTDQTGVLVAVLECDHEMPCTRYPIATALRCPECLPVRVYTPPPTEAEATS